MMKSKNGPKSRPARMVVDGRVRVRQSSLPQGYVTGKPVKAAAND
jgi:hypothetical protein